jgi:hypothetical protein
LCRIQCSAQESGVVEVLLPLLLLLLLPLLLLLLLLLLLQGQDQPVLGAPVPPNLPFAPLDVQLL